MPRTSERRPVTRLDPAVRRTQIIESAARLFERRDPVEVPFEEIADAAGVSRALVYNYFGDRGGLPSRRVPAPLPGASTTTWPRPPIRRRRPRSASGTRCEAYLAYAAEHPGAWRLLHGGPGQRPPRRRRGQEPADGRARPPLGRLDGPGSWPSPSSGCLEAATIEWLTSAADDVPADRLGEVLSDLLWAGHGRACDRHGIAVPAGSRAALDREVGGLDRGDLSAAFAREARPGRGRPGRRPTASASIGLAADP